MTSLLLAPLLERLRPHFPLSNSRLLTLCVLIVGLANTRTVNLSHLASQFPGEALLASNYRRLQRFFQHARLDGDVAAQLIVHMLNLSRPKVLALDRTNWKLGARNINILVLAIVTRRFRVPLMWSFVDHQGNSSTAQRVALMQRYLRLFGVLSIDALLADREFIGSEWFEFLCDNNVPFVIRLREDMWVQLEDGGCHRFTSLLRKRRHGVWRGWLSAMERTSQNRLFFEAKRIRGEREAIIVGTNIEGKRRALNLYRRRWGIECLFADAKTRGLNIEDTHMTNPAKLATLLVNVALAIVWAYRCATRTLGRGTIAKKTHGRRRKSCFRIGLDELRQWIIHYPDKALYAWLETCPRRKIKQIGKG